MIATQKFSCTIFACPSRMLGASMVHDTNMRQIFSDLSIGRTLNKDMIKISAKICCPKYLEILL